MIRTKKYLEWKKINAFVDLPSFFHHTGAVTDTNVELNHDYTGSLCHGNSFPLRFGFSWFFFFLMLIVYAIHNISTYFRDMFRFLA